MKLSFFLLTSIFFICSCSDTKQGKIQLEGNSKTSLSSIEHLDTTKKRNTITIAKKVLTHDTLPKTDKMILVSSGQASPFTTVLINGCNFDLVINENDTTYLATYDKNFNTPEGYKVGTKLSELPKRIQHTLTKEPGWGFYYKLPSGWNLGFCEGNSCTDNYPKLNAKVKWIFKRH